MNHLAALRRSRALTQLDVADRLGVHQSVVSRIENGHNMQMSTLLGYLAAIGASSVRVVASFADADAGDVDVFVAPEFAMKKASGSALGLTGVGTDAVWTSQAS